MSGNDDRKERERAERAAVPRQDATGLDIPAGRSADELRPEDYRPAEVTDSDSGEAKPGKKPR